jgi:geranylgeranyl reductase family protein
VKTTVYDVVVVGAGPAGSCAAKFLADAGAAVALLDAARFPRHKPCAGWINERLVGEFAFLDAVRRRIKALPFKRMTFHSPDLAQSAQFSGRAHAGYIVTREKFDLELVRAAEGAGAKPILGKRVAGIEAGERQVAAVLADGRRVTGRILIGADGVHSTVARLSGLRPEWAEEHLVLTLSKTVPLTARQRASCFGCGGIHVALGFGGAPGYAWAFPGAAQASVGIGVRARGAGRLKELYAAWVEGLRGKGLLPPSADGGSPEGGAVPAGAAIDFESHVGKRVILIGDAGGFASAASAEGIYPAIRSAAIAAECVLKALAADRGKIGTNCQDELMTFKHLWRQQLASYLQMPNVNAAFLLPLIYTNQEIADRFGRAFLFGENL